MPKKTQGAAVAEHPAFWQNYTTERGIVMKDSIHKYFQMGTIQWMSHPPAKYKVLDSIKTIACDDFFDAIEITKFADDATRDAAKAMLEQSHMKVCYGAQPRLLGPGLNPNDIDEEGRKKAEATLIEAVDEAEYLGAKAIAFLSGKWSPDTKDQAYAQLLKTTRAVCDYAGAKDMSVILEVFDYDMDKCSLIGPAPYAAQFAADMRCTNNNFGLMVDLSHFPTTYESSQFVIRTLRPYIVHFHIGNAVIKKGCPGYGDKHPRFGFPDSANDTPQLLDFFRVLKAEGFFDAQNPYVLSFEVMPAADEDGDLVLAGTKRVINRAWALLED
jgi:sugar phosphate isomerase/epimerase